MTKLIPEPLVSFFAPGFEAREQFAQDKHGHVDSVGLGQISHDFFIPPERIERLGRPS